MSTDWVAKLRHMLQVLAFALVIGTIQYAFQPDRPYMLPVTYSLCIATITWAVIDLGRDLFPSSAETGWPRGFAGVWLVMGGIVIGYVLGRFLADFACVYYGLYVGGPNRSWEDELRSSILITAMAGAVGSYYFYSVNKSAYFERKMGEAHKHANEARLKLLETQLEPHMLFNTLANLRALIAVDPERAQAMLDHMIAYLRATLSASRATSHTLQMEFDRLQDYLELMSIRMGQRLAFSLELPPELAQHPVPALLLQPLVENSIKHGLEPKLEGGRIVVSARREGADLVLEVCDTGIGVANAPPSPKGYGLDHVHERLATLHGSNGTLDLGAADDGGTRAIIRFPAQA